LLCHSGVSLQCSSVVHGDLQLICVNDVDCSACVRLRVLLMMLVFAMYS
jgi:hypothetical protein